MKKDKPIKIELDYRALLDLLFLGGSVYGRAEMHDFEIKVTKNKFSKEFNELFRIRYH